MATEIATSSTSAKIEEGRRGFGPAWGRMGGAGGGPPGWGGGGGGMGAAGGVPPSTAEVQGYLLVHGGPLTDAEIRDALGLSHRAVRLALEDCEAWGIIKRAPDVRRSGRRGPAGRAWIAVDDD